MAIHLENEHLNELVVLQALNRVHPNNERFAREILWLLYVLEGNFLLDFPEEDTFPVAGWSALRASNQYHPPAHQLLCWDLQTDTGIVMHQKRFYLLDFTSAHLSPCEGVPQIRTFSNTPPGTTLKGFTRQAALGALQSSFQHMEQRFPELEVRSCFALHHLLDRVP